VRNPQKQRRCDAQHIHMCSQTRTHHMGSAGSRCTPPHLRCFCQSTSFALLLFAVACCPGVVFKPAGSKRVVLVPMARRLQRNVVYTLVCWAKWCEGEGDTKCHHEGVVATAPITFVTKSRMLLVETLNGAAHHVGLTCDMVSELWDPTHERSYKAPLARKNVHRPKFNGVTVEARSVAVFACLSTVACASDSHPRGHDGDCTRGRLGRYTSHRLLWKQPIATLARTLIQTSHRCRVQRFATRGAYSLCKFPRLCRVLQRQQSGSASTRCQHVHHPIRPQLEHVGCHDLFRGTHGRVRVRV